MIKSTRIKALNRALYVIECPQCGRWLASASESSMLPEFAFCDCDSEQHTCGHASTTTMTAGLVGARTNAHTTRHADILEITKY